MKKYILLILFLLALIIAYIISGHFGREAVRYFIAPSKPTALEIKQELIQGFKESLKDTNAQLPLKINDDIQMDRATVGPDARVTYHYTFLKYSSKEIDTNWLNNKLKNDVVRQACDSDDMEASLRYGATYEYSYSGKEGIYIDKFEVTRRNCGLTKLTY